MKRLLILTTNFPPSTSIGTQRIIRICKYLDPSQWSISVLTLKEAYYPDAKHGSDGGLLEAFKRLHVYRTHKCDLVFYLLCLRETMRACLLPSASQKPVTVRPARKEEAEGGEPLPSMTSPRGFWQRVKDFCTDMFQFPDRHITWLPFAVWRGYRVIKREGVEVIFSSSPPHSLHIIAAMLKMLTGAKLVVDFRDPWARSPWHDEVRSLNGFERWKHRRIQKFERWVVRQADTVVLITREMRDDFVTYYSDLPAYKFQFFPNGYDPENLRYARAHTSCNDHKPSKVTFIHAGSLYKYRDPSPILHALENLFVRGDIDKDRLSLLFIGTITGELSAIPDLVKKQNIRDLVTFLPPVSYQKVMEYMAQSQVLMLLQPVTKLQLPGKFFDYLCLGKPIFAVGEKDSAVEHTIGEGYGIFADYNDVTDVEKALLFLYHNPTYNLEFIQKNRRIFDMSQSIQTFSTLLSS